jgi:ATP-binding cassette subfamily C protein LapB
VGNNTLSTDQFTQLLVDTGLDTLVESQPLGLDMPVGELGGKLSGGQRQMVALAAGLANDGNIVLMDEPTAAFDKSSEKQFLRKMATRLNNKTVIISTHKPSLLKLVDRIIIFEQGKIVIDGPKQQVLDQLAENQKIKTVMHHE